MEGTFGCRVEAGRRVRASVQEGAVEGSVRPQYNSHCTTFEINNESLIVKTCNKTPDANLCIRSIKSRPGSATANRTGLAEITMDVLNIKVIDVLNKIHDLQSAGTEPKQGLDSCEKNYTKMKEVDIPKAIQALRSGDGKGAEDVVKGDVELAMNCEKQSRGLLTSLNQFVRDVANVAQSIARQLYTKKH
ncbi:unnamed protein product [Lupinus luteus]|uniref:Pectinesterase inhibitor domain-containing protein n=1 Tax=Lupinus luteus TaxID=3873 RepID=A0AAV1WC25_LUPLU